jgi:6-phosphogluconolactonase (cycloisomerase 2 family)
MRAMLLALLALAPAALAGDLFVYVHNRAVSGTVGGFRLDTKTGELTELDGSPWPITDDGGNCGGMCETMDSARVGSHRFLLTGGVTGVTPWILNKDGTLTELPAKTAGGAGEWLGVTSVKKGGHVFVYANENTGSKVHGFELAKDGTLTELPDSPWDTGSGNDGIDSGKDLVVVMNEDDNSYSVFKVQKGGALVEAPGSPMSFPTDFSFNVGVDKTGRHVYSPADNQDIFGFVADKKTGELTALDNSPFDAGLPDQGTGFAFGSKPLIVAVNAQIDVAGQPALRVLTRSKDGQLLALGVPQAAATGGLDVQALSDDGKFLFVATDEGDQLEALSVDGKTGTIKSLDTAPITLINGNAIVVLKL